MSQTKYILSLDQGTTSSRAILFDNEQNIVCVQQREFEQIYPIRLGGAQPHGDLVQPVRRDERGNRPKRRRPQGHCGHWHHQPARDHHLWDKSTGRPVYNAIVWQCRRTAAFCDRLAAEGVGAYIRDKTGLLIDAYFSGTKIRWILDNVEGARERAERGELIFGTVDSWLIWNLTGGREHISDYSNCSRTMLFDIDRLRWDEDLCRVLGVPMSMLPAPVPNSAEYGRIRPG